MFPTTENSTEKIQRMAEEEEEVFGTWEGNKDANGIAVGSGIAQYPNEDKYEVETSDITGVELLRRERW